MKLDLVTFSDSSWGDNHPIVTDSNVIDQKSISGFLIIKSVLDEKKERKKNCALKKKTKKQKKIHMTV